MGQGTKPLGVMRPLGGGDPIPLYKTEITVGRRATCEVRLDFENVSGKHCLLRLVEGVWHVRDLGSTNGTTINRQKLDHEHGLMPDDELGIATNYFRLDYDPVTNVMASKEVLEQEMARVEPERQSLMEMAGIENDPERRRLMRKIVQKTELARQTGSDRGDFDEPSARSGDSPAGGPKQVSDDDFFKFFEEDVKKKR